MPTRSASANVTNATPSTRRRRRAFTLLELLLVMALLGLLVALAWPDFSATARAENLSESALRIQTLIAMCRAEAMNGAKQYRIEIRPDGSLAAWEQVDPILAPHLHNPVRGAWGRTQVLLPDVWIAAVQTLPDGPAPIKVIDEELEFPEMEIEPIPIEEFEDPLYVDIAPDGACPSLRLVLRDDMGRAVLLTLDGRLGRFLVEDWERIPEEEVTRPEMWEVEEPEVYHVEDFQRQGGE